MFSIRNGAGTVFKFYFHFMKKQSQNAEFHVSLKLIIKDKFGKILLLPTQKDSSLDGFCDLPGGRIQESTRYDPFAKNIEREIREELGKNFKYKLNHKPVAISRHEYYAKKLKKQRYLLCVFFEAKYLGGNINISDEHKDFLWTYVNKKNLKKYFVKGPLEGMTHYLTGKLG